MNDLDPGLETYIIGGMVIFWSLVTLPMWGPPALVIWLYRKARGWS